MRLLMTMSFTLLAAAASAAEPSREDLMALRSVCKADLAKLCAGITPGGGRIAACLKENAAAISAPCRDQLLVLQAKRQAK